MPKGNQSERKPLNSTEYQRLLDLLFGGQR